MANYSNVRTGVKGCDLSANQGNVNFATMYAQGIRFAIIRTVLHWQSDLDADTLLNVALDPYAITYSHGARAQGIEVCGYHYITPPVVPRREGALREAERYADGLMRVFGDLDPGYPYGKNIPTLDVEYPYPNNYAYGMDDYVNWVYTCAEHLKEITGFNTVIIYTAQYFASGSNNFSHSVKGTILQNYPLWLSAKDPTLYTGVNITAEPVYPNSNFTTFGNWGSWLGWQYSLDLPDTRIGATYGVSSPDLDLDVLAPGLGIEVMTNDYWKPRNTTIGGSVMATGGTNLNNISLSGDTYIKSPTTTKETLVKNNFIVYKNIAYTDITATATLVNGVPNTLRLIDGIPGKRILISKCFVYTPTTWAGGTQGLSIESDEVTPKVWGSVVSTNMTSGNKTNTDAFTGFTAGANYLLPFPDGVGVQLRDIATPTSGTAQVIVNFEYL